MRGGTSECMRKARVKNGRGRHAWGTCEDWSLGYATGTAVRAPRNNAWLTIDANGKGILTVPFAWEQLLLLLETNEGKIERPIVCDPCEKHEKRRKLSIVWNLAFFI